MENMENITMTMMKAMAMAVAVVEEMVVVMEEEEAEVELPTTTTTTMESQYPHHPWTTFLLFFLLNLPHPCMNHVLKHGTDNF